ncbi:hypothetical protein FB451DRAFT_1181357 [Mycena latifolia]|nr:hypothetical protein FB451DRAFT_1181357 [Mycena latifolia]
MHIQTIEVELLQHHKALQSLSKSVKRIKPSLALVLVGAPTRLTWLQVACFVELYWTARGFDSRVTPRVPKQAARGALIFDHASESPAARHTASLASVSSSHMDVLPILLSLRPLIIDQQRSEPEEKSKRREESSTFARHRGHNLNSSRAARSRTRTRKPAKGFFLGHGAGAEGRGSEDGGGTGTGMEEDWDAQELGVGARRPAAAGSFFTGAMRFAEADANTDFCSTAASGSGRGCQSQVVLPGSGWERRATGAHRVGAWLRGWGQGVQAEVEEAPQR